MSEATVEADEQAGSDTSRLAALQAYLAATSSPDAGRVLEIAQATLAATLLFGANWAPNTASPFGTPYPP